ncbi:hypothetical protein [Paludibacterium denitrificans]|uniref:hypothetical protein n=1 Tax=Paludibacterium denitrificans TaxID=2675226 RepID=UPI001E2E465B|nr:hypothetical protein [Paludibacterium denitrificans]
MALTLTLAGMTGRDLIGRRYGRSVVMLMIGCIGLITTGHQLTPVVACFAGFAAAFYALSLTLRFPGLAGAILGAASVVIFLSSSLLELTLLWAVVLLLPAFSALAGQALSDYRAAGIVAGGAGGADLAAGVGRQISGGVSAVVVGACAGAAQWLWPCDDVPRFWLLLRYLAVVRPASLAVGKLDLVPQPPL